MLSLCIIYICVCVYYEREDLYTKHKTFHAETCVFTAPDAHKQYSAYITQIHMYKHTISRKGSRISRKFTEATITNGKQQQEQNNWQQQSAWVHVKNMLPVLVGRYRAVNVTTGVSVWYWLSHQLDTWSKLSCILLLICKISFPNVFSVVSSANMSQSTVIFSRVMESH